MPVAAAPSPVADIFVLVAVVLAASVAVAPVVAAVAVNVLLQSRFLPARGRVGLEVHRCLRIIDVAPLWPRRPWLRRKLQKRTRRAGAQTRARRWKKKRRRRQREGLRHAQWEEEEGDARGEEEQGHDYQGRHAQSRSGGGSGGGRWRVEDERCAMEPVAKSLHKSKRIKVRKVGPSNDHSNETRSGRTG
jgi:hypothetical protein